MNKFVFYLAVVAILGTAWADLNLLPGYIWEVNVYAATEVQGSWVVIYGNVGSLEQKVSYTYFQGPFVQFRFLSAPAAGSFSSVVELNSLKESLRITDTNWYILVTPLSSLANINNTCDLNLDTLIEDNFCPDCTPEKTYTLEKNIVLNGSTYCAKYALVGDENVPTYVLESNSEPIYLSPIDRYVEGNFLTLLAADTNRDFFVYLMREKPLCGDLVCDPGEEGNCEDCYDLEFHGVHDITLGQSLTVTVTLHYLGMTGGKRCIRPETNMEYTVNPGCNDFSGPGDANFTLTLTPSQAGTYTIPVYVTDILGNVRYYSESFTFKVTTPTEENAGEEAGGAAPPPEENAPPPPGVPEGAVYIPELGCYSYLHLFGSDVVRANLEENVPVNILVTSAGTCDEKVSIDVHGIPETWYSLEWNNETVPAGESRQETIYIKPTQPGQFSVQVVAKGYTTDIFTFTLVVSGERIEEEERCTHSILIVAPEQLRVVEGEELNNVLIRNLGTCREDVSIRLALLQEGEEFNIDTKSLTLNKGERYVYVFPRLAPGTYKLYIAAGNQEKTAEITVVPVGAAQALAETISTYRMVIIVTLILLLIGALAYVRLRYLR